MKGYVMQVQPFSVNDGNGIRTTIFLAGCPLRCRWCSNPEGFSAKPLVGWYQRKCTGCGACAGTCPVGIGINLNPEREKCTACGACTEVCPTGARTRMVRVCDSDEILEQIRRDEIFYRFSGGGITFSGGEATSQPELLDELSTRIYDMGLSMTLESCGHFSFPALRPVLERMDLIFMDLKLMDDARHRLYTGVSNTQTLENIRSLADVSAEVVIRIPVIGGVNNDDENIRSSAAYVHKNLPKAKMELLPYHTFGTVKYEAIGKPYTREDFYRPSKDEMARLEEIVRSEGVMTESFS